jgi:hypothetical protein
MDEAGDLVIARSIVTWAGLEPTPSGCRMSCMDHAQFGQDVMYEAGDLVIARSIVL